MAALTAQNIVRAGTQLTFAAASGGGDTLACDNGQRHALWVKNGSGVSVNVTITAAVAGFDVPLFGQVAITNNVVAVPAGQDRIIGPFNARDIAQDGNVAIAYSATASVTVAAIYCLIETP